MHAARDRTGTDPVCFKWYQKTALRSESGPFAPVVVFNESLVTAFGLVRFSLAGSEPEKFKLAQT